MEEKDITREKKEIDLFDFWRVALKRKWIIFSTVLIVLVLAGLYTFTTAPKYKATATVLIEDPTTTMLNIEELFNYGFNFMGTYFNTQLEILKTKSLAERVSKSMNLADRPEIQEMLKPKRSLISTAISFFLRLFKPPKNSTEQELETFIGDDNSPNLSNFILDNLKVNPIKETKLIGVSYISHHPTLAVDIANGIVDEFINFSVEMRYEATQQASDFLNDQIAQIREQLTELERELQKYGEEKKLLFLNDSESTVLNKYTELYKAYTDAQIDRIKNEAIYRELKSLKIDSMPQYVNNDTIQEIKTSYMQKKTEFEVKSKTYKPDYPTMISLKTEVDTLRRSLIQEIEKATEAALSDLRAVQKREESLKGALETQWGEVSNMNTNEILYHSKKIQVENKRKLLNELDSRKNETLVSARLKGLKTSNIKVIDRAGMPKLPVSPNKKRNLVIALILGLFLGAGFAFTVDYLDNTVKGPDEVEKLVGLPALGVIPMISGNNSGNKYHYYSRYGYSDKGHYLNQEAQVKDIELVTHLFPNLAICEDYRTVRTSILFSHAGTVPKTIALTSSFPQEGKSSTITNLSISFSQLDKNVLLIDADMRKPRLHKIFGARNRVGLSSFLVGAASVDSTVQKTAVKKVWLMPSGPHPPNPAELINSKKMEDLIEQVKDKFDFVFIDTPPVLAVVDPVVISALCDSVVIVLKEGHTSKRALMKAVGEIRRVKSNIVGVIFNEVKVTKKGYYSPYYHNYNYMHSYEYRQEERDEA
jgi:capsular exopolysaccharide synthesis family protein